MFFFFIIGMRFITWGSEQTAQAIRCGQCGTVAPFKLKKGMRFITLFFVIPVIPLSGVSHIAQCPNCKARYQATPAMLEPPPPPQPTGGSLFS